MRSKLLTVEKEGKSTLFIERKDEEPICSVIVSELEPGFLAVHDLWSLAETVTLFKMMAEVWKYCETQDYKQIICTIRDPHIAKYLIEKQGFEFENMTVVKEKNMKNLQGEI